MDERVLNTNIGRVIGNTGFTAIFTMVNSVLLFLILILK